MKKLKAVICFTLLAISVNTANSQGIHFEKGLSWEQVKAKAKKENKYIFLDIYATWCGPCKVMDRNVFSEKNVGDFINGNFIAVKVQTDSTMLDSKEIMSWRADAAKIKKEYQVKAYPTYVFLMPNGQIAHMVTGAMPEQVFLAESERALNPESQYRTLLQRYTKGERDPGFVRYLAKRANEVGQKAEARKIAVSYINSLTEDKMYDPENIRFIYSNTKTSADKGFQFFLKNGDKIAQADTFWKPMFIKGLPAKIIIEENITPYFRDCDGKPDWAVVKNILVSKFGKTGKEIWETDKSGWIFKYDIRPFLDRNPSINQIEAECAKRKSEVDEEKILGFIVLYYLNASSEPKADLNMICDRVVHFWDKYVERFPNKISLNIMNQQAWFIFERSMDKKHLESAMRWAKKGVEISPPSIDLNVDQNTRIIDTYANLLYKLGRIKEAIEWEEKAIKIAPDSNGLLKTVQKTLADMRAGLPTWKTDNGK
ncbi:thioredoxin family protein [Pedobacter deserti]|uniref:thioredoxin family protein n=1 Tax=Pedobacter deserti TaxID=2817382 RepID=UPI002109FBDC|nr:thioredoxin family protein [Pedobacter sp. SYSU D00382]